MEYTVSFADGSTAYLAHHGVKGMHWGVRNAETLARYAGGDSGSKPTKREVKKAIRQSKREHRKATGEWRTTGQNMSRVTKEHRKAVDSDEILKKHSAASKAAEERIEKEEGKLEQTKLRKDHLTRLQQDPEASREMRRAAERDYLKAKDKSRKSNEKIELARMEIDKADDAYNARRYELGKQYRKRYENAVIKDLGFKDVEAGRQLLNEYGLMDKTLRSRKY